MLLYRILSIFVLVFTSSAYVGSDDGQVYFNPILWLQKPLDTYIPSGEFKSRKFNREKNMVETAKIDDVTYIRHKYDFLSHMFDAYDQKDLKTKEAVVARLNKLYKQKNKDVKSHYQAFQLLYQTKMLSNDDKIEWIESRYENLEVPFIFLISILWDGKGSIQDSMKWRLYGVRRLEYDILMCQDDSVDNARTILRIWWIKETFERYLIRKGDQEPPGLRKHIFKANKTGLELYHEYYGGGVAEKDRYHNAMNIWLDRWIGSISQDDRSLIVASVQQLERHQEDSEQSIWSVILFQDHKPYWLIYHGLDALYNNVSSTSFLEL